MVSKINNNYRDVLEKFLVICDKNNLWYSLANNTLLSAKTNNNYFENIDIMEVFVTNETFMFLKTNYKNNLIDFTCSDIFFLSTPFFYVQDNDKFIKIIIIVPTTIKKVNNFYNLKNKIKYNYSNLLTFKKGYTFSTKVTFFWLNIFSKFFSPMEQNNFYDSLYSDKYNGFLGINSLNETSSANWFPNLTFKVDEILFLDLNVKIIKEYHIFLNTRYGNDWKNGVEIKPLHFNYTKILSN